MIACSHCGQQNAEGTRICRYCGRNLAPGTQLTQQAEYVPPTPFWTGEQPRHAAPVAQAYGATPQPQAAGYVCPHCGSNYHPQVIKKVSTDGWIVFALLLFFCPPFFWIGLLMKEEYRRCTSCGAQFG
jgi:hypothetical protein